MKEVDPQWTNLVFSPAERSDEGVYKCTAQVGEQTLSQRIELHLYEKIQMEDTPAVQHPHDGEDARIVCHVRADPPASIMWLRNDDVIVEGGERGYRLYNDSSTLYIPHFSSESDNGVYRCQAIQQETGDFQSIDISVDAYVKPRVDFFSPSVEVNEDDDAAMSCTATGNPPPEVFWFKNDFRISNDSKYMTEETGSLLIRQVNADDIGSYECRATNLLGSVSRSIDLSVFLKPQLEMLRDMEAKKGDSISVSCKFSGGDPMHIVWKSKGITLDPEPSENDVSVTSPLPERYSVTKSGDIVALHIESLQMDDAGMYECMASNQADPPEMTEKEMLSLRAVNGQTVVMSCQVSAVPEPTWTWLSPGGDELSSDATKYFIETSSSNLNSSLRVVISNAHDYGHYACKADNKVGDPAIRLIDVFEVHIPPKPELIFENQHPNYASILIPNYAGIQSSSQPLQIVFEVAKESDFMSGDFNWEEGDVAQTVLDYDSSSSYTVKGLVPLTKYVLRVHSKNEAGMSEYAEAPYETVRPRIPEAPTFKPFAEGNHCSPINCLVSWDEPNDGGSDILGYDIEYQSVGALSDGSSMSVDEGKWIPVGPISASEQYVVLRHLEPVTAYMIRARARNDQGESNWGQTFFETTSESWSSSGDEKKPLKDSLQSQDERNDVNDDSTKMLSSGKDKSEKKNTVV
ncbi:immunoglobulin domain protein [Trichuris suis]|nr:immunoglobulin domain protein [Trichuris suis]